MIAEVIVFNPQFTAQFLPSADVPLYDQPLEMSGKRDRKKVERFVQETKKEEPNATGCGVPLGDIPFIEAMITVCLFLFGSDNIYMCSIQEYQEQTDIHKKHSNGVYG